jgi:hypothetical protein
MVGLMLNFVISERTLAWLSSDLIDLAQVGNHGMDGCSWPSQVRRACRRDLADGTWLSRHTARRIDLETIWRQRETSPTLSSFLETPCDRSAPTHPPSGGTSLSVLQAAGRMRRCGALSKNGSSSQSGPEGRWQQPRQGERDFAVSVAEAPIGLLADPVGPKSEPTGVAAINTRSPRPTPLILAQSATEAGSGQPVLFPIASPNFALFDPDQRGSGCGN